MTENPYPLAWAGLIAAGTALELLALRRTRGPATLSSNVWTILHYAQRRSRALGWTARILVLAGCILLGIHLAFEWPK